jgi:hypothetical protein
MRRETLLHRLDDFRCGVREQTPFEIGACGICIEVTCQGAVATSE